MFLSLTAVLIFSQTKTLVFEAHQAVISVFVRIQKFTQKECANLITHRFDYSHIKWSYEGFYLSLHTIYRRRLHSAPLSLVKCVFEKGIQTDLTPF